MTALTAKDLKTINAITDRASTELTGRYPGMNISDKYVFNVIAACHEHCVPLRLDDFLAARDHEFMNEILGLLAHMDLARDKPHLGVTFHPRFAG